MVTHLTPRLGEGSSPPLEYSSNLATVDDIAAKRADKLLNASNAGIAGGIPIKPEVLPA
jgi:hypothetical protein